MMKKNVITPRSFLQGQISPFALKIKRKRNQQPELHNYIANYLSFQSDSKPSKNQKRTSKRKTNGQQNKDKHVSHAKTQRSEKSSANFTNKSLSNAKNKKMTKKNNLKNKKQKIIKLDHDAILQYDLMKKTKQNQRKLIKKPDNNLNNETSKNKKTSKNQKQLTTSQYNLSNEKSHVYLTPKLTPNYKNNQYNFHKSRNLSNEIRSTQQKYSGQKVGESSSKISSQITPVKPKLLRYEKFAFRSQKHIKLSEQVERQKQMNKKKELQQIQLEKQKAKTAFKTRINKLNDQIALYKNKGSDSLKAIRKMKQIKKKQEREFQMKKSAYLQQIRQLQQQIEEKKTNLGHIYTYKQFNNENLIPNEIIIQSHHQNETIIKCKFLKQKELQQKAGKIIELYLNKKQQELEIQNCEDDSKICLSIISKQSD